MSKHVDLELEMVVLGGLLNTFNKPESVELSADDFTRPWHREVLGAIRALSQRCRPVEPITILEELRIPLDADKGRLDDIRSLQFRGELLYADALQTRAETLRRLSLLRKMEVHAKGLLEALERPVPDPAALAALNLDFANNFIGSAAPNEPPSADVHELVSDWDAFERGERRAHLRTGIDILDSVFDGFVPSLNLIGGRASVGKTALVAEMIMGWLRQGIKVGLFGLEDRTRWLTDCHVSRAIGIPVGKVAASHLSRDQGSIFAETCQELVTLFDKSLIPFRRAGITASALLAEASKWIHVNKAQVIVIDHGGRIRLEQKKNQRNDEAIGDLTKALADMAANTGVPIIALWHLNREAAKAGMPVMEGWKNSGYLEADSRTMLGLWERPDRNPGQLLCTVVKATNGKKDVTVAIERDAKHGLVRRTGGHVVDFDAEGAAEHDAKRATPTRTRHREFLNRKVGTDE